MLIDGKGIAQEIRAQLADRISRLKERKPGLVFIRVGENPSSLSYIRAKQKACAEVGIISWVVELPEQISQSELLLQIHMLNENRQADGILIQLPLPPHISESAVMSAINPEKDVDGFHPINVGKMLLGDETGFLPCTPNGIRILLEKSHIPVAGKHVVILGRSNIVGKPLAAILMQKKKGCNATVTVGHSQSERLVDLIRSADILIAAMGKPRFIKKEMIQPGATVIDVGNNWLPAGQLTGDVDFEGVSQIAGKITPVPGGVGPMTIAMLLENTWKSYTEFDGS